MSSLTFASIHVIGLGGTGTNIIQSLVESERLRRLLASEDFNIACLAVDVADGDLGSLQTAYKGTLTNLEAKGISVDRLWVKTHNIKFNTPDALFEFMERYNVHLTKEGIVVDDYKPWIKSSMSIPPLAGGVGRQRALSKAVYALNYFHYVEINSIMSVFKDRVLTSKYQPIVVIIYGLGGGTGSGMVFDFARHLRAKLGSAVPLVGLTILPRSADDLLSRGPAPYASLMESDLVFNWDSNERVMQRFGEAYRNPFTAQFYLALDPVYNNRNSLVSAKKELDDAVVDMIHLFMTFDLADLLSRTGTNNDFGENWAHTIAYLRIRYPVEDYLRYLHEYLQLAESVGNFLNEKRQTLMKINEILSNRHSLLVDLFKKQLISINDYRADTFNAQLEDVIRRAGKYEIEFRKQMKGLQDFASYYNDKWSKALRAMIFAEDTVEYMVMQQLNKFGDDVSHIGRTYDEFRKELSSRLSELENSIMASKYLTSTQIRQIRSYVNLASLIGTSIETIDLYLRTKALADELAIRYSKEQSKERNLVMTIGETELVPLFKTSGAILTRVETEVRMAEQFIPGIKVIKRNLESRYKEESDQTALMERMLAQKESEGSRLRSETQRIRIDVSGKRKTIQRHLKALETEIRTLGTGVEQRRVEDDKLRSELEKITELERSVEATSQYRKLLNSTNSKSNELNSMMSVITSTSSYYERVVELSEVEQIKIMEKILREEESSLKGEGILKEIVDRDRFRDIVKSYVRIFSVPNYAGLSDSYRTDLIWTTISMPPGLWDQELQGMLSSTLNVFSSVEATKSISIRQIPQVDPWTITFLIILAKAKVENIEKFTSMKNDAQSIKKSERVLFRSFLLEHGFQEISELTSHLGIKS